MGQHATIHGKTNESFNGQDGKWIPARIDSTGQLYVTMRGDLGSSLNRIAGGAIASYAAVSGDGAVKASPGILYGIMCVTNGTIQLYDNASAASGTTIYPATALTAGTIVHFGGVGMITLNGIYADITGGTYVVLYA